MLKRPADVAARYGGEEFAAILPDTSAEQAPGMRRDPRARRRALAAACPGRARPTSRSASAWRASTRAGERSGGLDRGGRQGAVRGQAGRPQPRRRRSGRRGRSVAANPPRAIVSVTDNRHRPTCRFHAWRPSRPTADCGDAALLACFSIILLRPANCNAPTTLSMSSGRFAAMWRRSLMPVLIALRVAHAASEVQPARQSPCAE